MPIPKLVELEPLMPNAIFDMRYATENNITGRVLYKNNPPRLQSKAAQQAAYAAKIFATKGLCLVVFDAYRPKEAHRALLEINDNPMYVLEDSNHPKGLALDGTLATAEGRHLDMGTDFDDFTPKAHVDSDQLSPIQKINRALLAGVMAQAGFEQWPYEWWHFDFVGTKKHG